MRKHDHQAPEPKNDAPSPAETPVPAAELEKRRAIMKKLRREEMTRRRAKEALRKMQKIKKREREQERRRKRQKRCGGGFVVSFDDSDAPLRKNPPATAWGGKSSED